MWITLRFKTEGQIHTQTDTQRLYTGGNRRKRSNFFSSFFFGNRRPHPLLRRHFRLSCLPGSLYLFFCPCRCFPMLRAATGCCSRSCSSTISLYFFARGLPSTEIHVTTAKTLLFFCAHNVVGKHQQSLP